MVKQSQVVSLRTSETIEHEASVWMTKLDRGNLSDEERLELKKWLSEDPEHVYALKELVTIWKDMDVILNHSSSNNQSRSASFKAFPNIKWVPALVTACLVSIILMSWPSIYQPVQKEIAIYSTAVGVQQTQKFSDGSSAYLNTDSIIETEFSDDARIVRLLHGEAMFEVAHEPERPFIVYAGNREVMAIGTKFIVRLTSETMLVTVTEGQVQLSKRAEEKSPDNLIGQDSTQAQEVVILSKGQEVEVKNDDGQATPKIVNNDEMDQRIAWLNGQLLFKNKPLDEVIKEVSRYVPSRIIIEDPELRDVHISGRFEIGDTDALFEAIEVSFDVQVSYIDEKIIRLSQ